MSVLLAACNESDSTQLFSYDPTSTYIHPQESTSFCLDFEFDQANFRPLTVFRCDKTFSKAAKPRHQEWTFANGSNIVNTGTKKCVATGTGSERNGKIYDGKAVQQYACGELREQWWNWVPRVWSKTVESGRAFVV